MYFLAQMLKSRFNEVNAVLIRSLTSLPFFPAFTSTLHLLLAHYCPQLLPSVTCENGGGNINRKTGRQPLRHCSWSLLAVESSTKYLSMQWSNEITWNLPRYTNIKQLSIFLWRIIKRRELKLCFNVVQTKQQVVALTARVPADIMHRKRSTYKWLALSRIKALRDNTGVLKVFNNVTPWHVGNMYPSPGVYIHISASLSTGVLFLNPA